MDRMPIQTRLYVKYGWKKQFEVDVSLNHVVMTLIQLTWYPEPEPQSLSLK